MCGFGLIGELDGEAVLAAGARWDCLAKPVGSLGEFERLVTRMAGVRGTADVRADRRVVVVFCADNGVTAEGICGSDPALTAIIAESIAAGRGNVSAMAAAANCRVVCVDVGLFGEGTPKGVLPRKVRRGTRNFAEEPAMTAEETMAALSVGEALAGELAGEGADVLLAGEAGMGNTTTSAAVAAALLDLPANAVAGRGAGLDDAGLARKVRVIDAALERYGLRTAAEEEKSGRAVRDTANASLEEVGISLSKKLKNMEGDAGSFGTERTCISGIKTAAASRQAERAFRVLSSVGGFDIAAMAGFYIGCAKARVPVILDGAISAAAGLLAERLAPGTVRYMFASHESREPMASYLLRELGLRPVIRADLALGEGTGAVCLLPLLDLALAAYRGAATFSESGLEVGTEGSQPTYRVEERPK